jgi:beta-N-acetylhexosaminidase
MHGRKALDRVRLRESPEWHRALGHIAELESHDSLELPLEDPTIPEPRTKR